MKKHSDTPYDGRVYLIFGQTQDRGTKYFSKRSVLNPPEN